MPIHDWSSVDAGVFHDFHLVWIGRLKGEFESQGFAGQQMSGSGSSYFGICHHAAQARRDRDDAEQPQDTQRAQHRQALRGGHQRDGDDGKVEHVPAAAEETVPVGDQLEGDLDHEDGQCDAVKRHRHPAKAGHRGA